MFWLCTVNPPNTNILLNDKTGYYYNLNGMNPLIAKDETDN